MFLAIIKYAKDSTEAIHKKLPPEYPVQVVEGFETEEAAQQAYPGCRVMSADAYKFYLEGLNVIYNHVEAKKPWWKVWGA